MATPRRVDIPDGVHAANRTGMVSLKPKANTKSEKKNSVNPVNAPPQIINVVLPCRDCRRVNVAAIKTIAQSRSGVDNNECQ